MRETASLALRRIEHVTKKKSAIVGASREVRKETTAVGIAEKDDDDDDDDDDVRHAIGWIRCRRWRRRSRRIL